MKSLFLLIIACAITPLVQAATINVDLNNGSSPTYSGTAVLGGGYWNGINTASASALLGSDNVATAIGFSIGGGAFDGPDGGNTPAGLANDLLRDYRYQNNGNLTLTITGLVANGLYDLVLYSSGDQKNQGSSFTGNGFVGSSTTAEQRDTFAEGVNYSKGTVTANASGQVLITISPNISTYAVLNGFQISAAPVPEPTAAALGLLGSVALLRRRRR